MKSKFFDILSSALKELNFPTDKIIIQVPKNIEHGDYTTNYPLINAKEIGDSPIQIAESIVDKIKDSSFFLALKISYPNPWDIRRALELNYHPGGQIMIHGVPNIGYDQSYHNSKNDWTEGCIAVSNQQMLEIWKKVSVGTPILIKK